MKKYILITTLLFFKLIYSQNKSTTPMIPIVPAIPVEKEKIRTLLKTKTLTTKVKGKVIVPLEIISDVNIKALIVDDENVKVPFQVQLNRKPQNENIYNLKFSSTKIDIDRDGKIDTEIFSNRKITNKTIRDNYVKITGKNISNEGTFKKTIYITVEVRD